MAFTSGNENLLSEGIVRSLDNLVLFYDAPQAAFTDLRDAICGAENYQDEIVLAPTRQWTPLLNGSDSRVLSAAGEDVDFPGGTVGQPVANPQTRAQFADAIIDKRLRDEVIAWKHAKAQGEADDITTIGTPDVGG